MSEPADLLKWLRRQRLDIHADPESDDRALIRLDLVHTIDGEGFEKLDMMRISEDSESEELAATLYANAIHDSETRLGGTPQRYAVLGFRSAEARDHTCQYAFVIRTATTRDFLGTSTEPPTEKGMQSHFLRHDEAMHRLMMTGSEAMMGRLANELSRETERRYAAENAVMQIREHEQELLDRKAERDLKAAIALQNAKWMADIGGLVTSMLPLIAAKFLAGKDSNIAASAPQGRDLAIQKFLKTLNNTKMLEIMQTLEPTQAMNLMEIYKSYAEDELKEQAGRQELLRDGQEKTREEAH